MGAFDRDLQRERMDRLKHLGNVGQEELAQLFHELQVHQEELSAQNHQLIETQRALEESRDRYVDLYDFAPTGFMTISDSGMILEINLTGAALLHRERSKIIGLPFNAFVSPDDKHRFAGHLRDCRIGDRVSSTVELALRSSDAPLHLQLITRRHASEVDHKPAFFTALIDITERKHLEQERGEAEEARDKLVRDREIGRARSDARDHFLAILSHELRTPLTPIRATLSDSRLISLAPEPLLGALQTMRRSLDLEVRLIDDLLDVTRISRDRLVLTKERVDLHLVVREIVDMLAHEIGQRAVQVTLDFEAPRPWVIGDPIRLRQVFWNLLGNAIKFTEHGGRVKVTSAAEPDGFITIGVSDSGIGMDEAVLTSINTPADSDRNLPIPSATGLGLGLAICRGVVDAHGGTLRALSQGKERGSTLVVQIPIAAHLEDWDRRPVPGTPVPEPQARPQRILLVEDHEDSADTLAQLLTYHDYVVRVARTMADAIALSAEGFDLLISDIRLPDGSGLDLMRHLRATHPIRGIAISGFGTDQDQRRSREAGYERHLTKPVDFNQLLEAIEQAPSG